LPLPVADSTFENYGVNPYIVTSEERFSTFAMDVDTASYTITRGYLQRDVLPPRDAIRVEEFVNYFDQGYAPSEEVFTIELDGARSPYRDDGRHLLRIGIQGKDITFEERKDAVITFVIDTSGSMAIDSRIGLAKRALLTLVDNLHTGDRVGIVEYGSTARTLLEPTDDKAAIRMAISRLSAGGSTNAEAGLFQGYEMATAAFEEGKINRVVLVSDGVANVGETGPDAILAKIKEFSNDGITLSAIGVGFQNYNDVLLERLADNGDGNYVYLDNDDEATELFGSGLTGLLEVIASDAKIQVEFNPDTVRQYRLIGYENRALTTEQFRDDTVDAGEVGAGHSVTALYELVLVEGAPEGTIADVRVRYADPESGDVAEISSVVVTSEIDRAIGEASPRFRFSAAVTEFAEILRESPWAHDGSLGAVLAEAQEAVSLMDATPRDRGFIDLVQRAIQLSDG
jgi:Ca-activated chloride channel family protein